MPPEPVQYFNRYSGRIETENIYGGGILRWVYGNPLGRLSLHALVKRAAFSRWYGWRMNRLSSRKKVLPFIATYQIDTKDFADPPESFQNFNEFFYRKLNARARPVNSDPDLAVFPADGRHLGFNNTAQIEGIFVKGEVLSLGSLLQDKTLADQFHGGAMVLSRLCPVDYHRFHFPVDGIPDSPQVIPGPLFSVSPIALKRNIHILAQNRRAVGRIRSPQFGLVLMLEVGATNVGSFEYTFTPGTAVKKGMEKGFFKFGGSLIITLFEPGRIELSQDLVQSSRKGLELYTHIGDAMGRVVHNSSAATM